MKQFLILFFFGFPFATIAQELHLFQANTQWILETPKIEKKELRFVPYSKDRVDLNTMVWSFLPGGFIEYDYQSNEKIYSCAGVDFLDLDLSECRWEFNSAEFSITLLIKGGYASIDDFVFKRKYLISIDDSDHSYGYIFTKQTEYFFNDLSKK